MSKLNWKEVGFNFNEEVKAATWGAGAAPFLRGPYASMYTVLNSKFSMRATP
jgi:hypothetical protein